MMERKNIKMCHFQSIILIKFKKILTAVLALSLHNLCFRINVQMLIPLRTEFFPSAQLFFSTIFSSIKIPRAKRAFNNHRSCHVRIKACLSQSVICFKKKAEKIELNSPPTDKKRIGWG